MKAFILAALMAASSTMAMAQERIAITNGTVVTNTGQKLEQGVVLLSDGKVQQVGSNVAVPPGYQVIDASGKWVTPGIVAGISQFGVAEVVAVAGSNDLSAGRSPLSAALSLDRAYNPAETSIAVNRVEGVTSAVVAPVPSNSLFAGQGYLLSMAEGALEPMQAKAFQYISYGEEGARLSGGSRPAAWAELINALDEAKHLGRGKAVRDQSKDLRIAPEDLDALTQVVRGNQPLLVRVDRASDIRQILKLPKLYPGLKLVLVSANEGWIVAKELAQANVPVITLGMNNRPDNFQIVGATMSNVGRMVAAGVKVALGTPDLDASFQPRNLPHYAGNMVAQAKLPGGVGLTWDQAFASITKVPAEIFGMKGRGVLAAGAVADVVVWDGDPLELSSNPDHVIIGGVPQSMESRQTRLAKRYAPQKDRGQLPPAYKR